MVPTTVVPGATTAVDALAPTSTVAPQLSEPYRVAPSPFSRSRVRLTRGYPDSAHQRRDLAVEPDSG